LLTQQLLPPPQKTALKFNPTNQPIDSQEAFAFQKALRQTVYTVQNTYDSLRQERGGLFRNQVNKGIEYSESSIRPINDLTRLTMI
jgi:hypothetical protein